MKCEVHGTEIFLESCSECDSIVFLTDEAENKRDEVLELMRDTQSPYFDPAKDFPAVFESVRGMLTPVLEHYQLELSRLKAKPTPHEMR